MTLTRRSLSYGALFGIIAAAMSAGCASPEARVCEIDPLADPVLKRMCDTLDGAKAFSFHVKATMDRPVGHGFRQSGGPML